MKRAAWLVGALAVGWAACSKSGELTCEQDGGCGPQDRARLIEAIDAALAPGAVVLSSLQAVPSLGTIQGRVYDRRDGGALVVLWLKGSLGTAPGADVEKTSAVAFVGPTGTVTPLGTQAPAFGLFQGPPRGVEYGSGAVFVTCEVGPTATAWIADPAAGTLTSSNQAPLGACNPSNSPVRPMLGRGFDASRFVAASGQEIGIYAYSGTTLQKLQTFPANGSFYAWVEEIAPGVVAWVSWSNLQGDINGKWTYHRSDTGAGPSFANSASIVVDAYDQSGLETMRREADGSLLIATGDVKAATSGTGLFRWRVESDASLTKLGDSPAPPFGQWRPLSAWAAVTTDFQPNPRMTNLQTPAGHAAAALGDSAFSLFKLRDTPCADDSLCQRIGETYTLAVVGPPGQRTAIQALWTWAALPSDLSAVVVAVPTTEGAISGPPPPDASQDSAPIDSGVTDASSEEAATASCPAGCGAAGCDPLGGCAVEAVKSGPVISISTGHGVAWLQRTVGSLSSSLWWIAPGAPLTSLSSVASGGQVSGQDRVIADNLGAVFHDYFALYHTALPPTGAPTSVVGSGAVPDSLRLIGTTPTHVYTAQTATSPVAIRRWARGAWQSELLACTADWADGALDASERVFAAVGSGLIRLDGKLQTGSNCQGTNAGLPLDSGGKVPGVQRVALGTSHAYGLTASQVFAFDPAGAVAPIAVGPAQSFSSGEFPLATDGDAVIYVAAGALPGTKSYSVVAVESPGAKPHVLATAVDTVTAIASSGTHVYFADSRGLVRVPRTLGP